VREATKYRMHRINHQVCHLPHPDQESTRPRMKPTKFQQSVTKSNSFPSIMSRNKSAWKKRSTRSRRRKLRTREVSSKVAKSRRWTTYRQEESRKLIPRTSSLKSVSITMSRGDWQRLLAPSVALRISLLSNRDSIGIPARNVSAI